MADFIPPIDHITKNFGIGEALQAFFYLPEESDVFAPIDDGKRATQWDQKNEREFFKKLYYRVKKGKDREQISKDISVIEKKLSWIKFGLKKPDTKMMALYHIVRLYNHLCHNAHPLLTTLFKALVIKARWTDEVGAYRFTSHRIPLMIEQVQQWTSTQFAEITGNLLLISVVAATGDLIKDILILLTATNAEFESFVKKEIDPLHSVLSDVKDKELLVHAFNSFTNVLPDHELSLELLSIGLPDGSWEVESKNTELTCEQLLEKVREEPFCNSIIGFLEEIANSYVKVKLDFYCHRATLVHQLVRAVHTFLEKHFKVDLEFNSSEDEYSEDEPRITPLLKDVLKEEIEGYFDKPFNLERFRMTFLSHN